MRRAAFSLAFLLDSMDAFGLPGLAFLLDSMDTFGLPGIAAGIGRHFCLLIPKFYAKLLDFGYWTCFRSQNTQKTAKPWVLQYKTER